nr:glycosyl hydrolase [Prolixibacteraceae bacterium]
IEYAFDEPFVCRSLFIEAGNNFQAVRLRIEVADDGKIFRSLGRLDTPRHGWQDGDEGYTFALKPVTARYFRFVFDPEGTEPGAEDLDNAKWKPNLKIARLRLSGEARIGGIEGKNGSVWRIAAPTDSAIIANKVCIDPASLINLSDKMDSTGLLRWNAPPGSWILLRMGHTSNGHTNYTAGGGLGLEVDKFNPEAVRFQYNQWCGKIIETVGPEQVTRVLEIFHVDSWECGSQNWSPVFASEFEKRRGYNLLPMLPVMAGIPIESAAASEKFLYDVRQTIAELVVDNFYKVFGEKIRQAGLQFSGECVAPTMTSDGLLHYQALDIPMGEFWFRSPTHDKPNDALDAISGAHIYNKALIQAEGFTELRMAWDEHPGMLKTLTDRNFALGFNRYVFHVFTQNPWNDRKPGMTLDPIGLFFQRDQTWWKPGKNWIDYITRCQSILQQGKPVVDIAVYTGEEIPSRAVLPNRLIDVLPGIIGQERMESEKIRLINDGQPQREMPRYVNASAHIYDPSDWVDPLNGYAYDSFNPDALLRLAKVKKGRVFFSGDHGYRLLIVPGKRKMDPNGNHMSGRVAAKLAELIRAGASVLFAERPDPLPDDPVANEILKTLFDKQQTGKGKIWVGPYSETDFETRGFSPDFFAFDPSGKRIKGLAWNHRSLAGSEIYF